MEEHEEGTLYSLLKLPEEYNKEIVSRVGNIQTKISERDVTLAQGLAFQQYKSNPILSRAMERIQSIEARLEQLLKVNKRFGRILPRKKNPDYNKEVEALDELVGFTYNLRSRGIFSVDNVITGAVYATALLFGMSYVAPKLLGTNPEEIQQLKLIGKCLASFFGPLCGGFAGSSRRELPEQVLYERAQYIDRKIEEIVKK